MNIVNIMNSGSDVSNNSFEEVLKIVVVGDSGVGKSQLLNRFVSDSFTVGSKSTIGVEFSNKIITVDDTTYKIQLWDTAGQERYRAITGAYYRGSRGILLCYDSTNKKSFENLVLWLNEIDNNLNSAIGASGEINTIKIALVSTKNDMHHLKNVSSDAGKKYATENNMLFFETSAISGMNVDNAVVELVKSIHDSKKINKNNDINKSHKESLLILDKKTQKKSCCS